MDSLGQKLRGVREAKPGLSLRRLAARTRIDKHSLSLYERDEQEPPFSRIKQLCAHLEMRAGYLFDEIEELRHRRPAQVAALESFRLFGQRTRLTKVERSQLAFLAASKEAPTTVDEWKAHRARMRAGRGRPASAA
jgi:transcriptional regulator with XRE-family HTH domain